MIKNRNLSLDLLRVIACYLVMQQHASEYYYIGDQLSVVTGSNTFWIGIITSLCRTSVPLFVMLSGFLLLPMQDSISRFFRKRFTRIVYPFVVWCVIYAIYFMATRGESVGDLALHILHIPVNFGCEIGHLWYIYMLIGLYLVVPIISPWLERAGKRELEGYLALWTLTTFLPYIHLAYPEVLGEAFWNDTPLLYYFTGFIGYFILGYYLRRYGYPSALLSWVLLVAGYAVTAGLFCARIDTVATIPELELSWRFCTVNVLMMSLGLFSLIGRLKLNGQSRGAQLLTDISAKSYGMYLAHIIVLNFYYGLIHPLTLAAYIAIPLIAVCTFVTVYLLVKVIAWLPKSKYIIG
mgnify:FL=1